LGGERPGGPRPALGKVSTGRGLGKRKGGNTGRERRGSAAEEGKTRSKGKALFLDLPKSSCGLKEKKGYIEGGGERNGICENGTKNRQRKGEGVRIFSNASLMPARESCRPAVRG